MATETTSVSKAAVGKGEDETHLLDLPGHIIVENILAELVPSSLLGNVAKPKDLRDILSFASTCTRIHELASHPSVWRNVNAVMFSDRFEAAARDCVAPPPLPLGAVHCGVFRLHAGVEQNSVSLLALMKLFEDLTDVRICQHLHRLSRGRGCLVSMAAALPHLSWLEVIDGDAIATLADTRILSGSLQHLRVCCDTSQLCRVLSNSSFPSLSELFLDIAPSLEHVAPVIGRLCPALSYVKLGRLFRGNDVASLVAACPSLQRVEVEFSDTNYEAEGDKQHFCFPHLRELSITTNGRITGGFLSMFPNLVRLELPGPSITGVDTLTAIGEMANLERLVLNCHRFLNMACHRLLPLVNHPMTSGRRSLRSLELKWFCCDIGDFLVSPWCSSLADLTFHACFVSDSALGRFITAHGKTLATTLRSLVLNNTNVGRPSLSRFVVALPSLERLSIEVQQTEPFDGNKLVRELGDSLAELSCFSLSIQRCFATIDMAPLLHVLSKATTIALNCGIGQAAVDAIADSCHYLSRFSVTTAMTTGVTRPKSLAVTCEFNNTRRQYL